MRMALRRQGSNGEERGKGVTRHGCASVGYLLVCRRGHPPPLKGPPLGKYFKSCALIASPCLAARCVAAPSHLPWHVLEFLFAIVLLARVNYCQAIYNAQRAVLPLFLLLVPHGVCVTIIVIKCTQYFAIATLRLLHLNLLLPTSLYPSSPACGMSRNASIRSSFYATCRQNVPQTCVCIKRMTAPLTPSWNHSHTHAHIYCLSLMFS